MKIDFSEKLDKTSANSAFADMFGLNNESKKEGAIELDIDLLTPFKGHPFRLYEGEKLRRMVESIKENGVMTPIIVRKKEDGTNEILAGHNRVNASKLAGLTKVPSEIKVNLTDAQAKIIVTDSNFLQRSVDEMFPSELAKSLQMQLEACKEAKQKQEYTNAIESESNADRSEDWNEGVQLEHPGKSRDIIAKSNKMSTPSIQRYIRLNYLNEGLLNMVDDGSIKLVPAVSLSYLTINEQNILFSILGSNEYKLDISVNIVASYQGGTKYKLSASYTWLTTPVYTQIDVLGLGHDSGLTQTNDPVTSYFKDDWTNSWTSPSSGTDTNTSPSNYKNDSGGAVVSYQLLSHDADANGGYWRQNYRGYMSYYANVNSTSIRYVSIYGNYAHQQSTFAFSPSISWPLSVGFSVSSSQNFDFLSPNPYLSIHVNY